MNVFRTVVILMRQKLPKCFIMSRTSAQVIIRSLIWPSIHSDKVISAICVCSLVTEFIVKTKRCINECRIALKVQKFEPMELKTTEYLSLESNGSLFQPSYSTFTTRCEALIWVVNSITLIIIFFSRTFQEDELEAALSHRHGSG